MALRDRIRDLIRRIPEGQVATYGQLAAWAGNPRAARVVVWVLRNAGDDQVLPWHRVINSRGRVSLPRGDGFELQRALLRDEGVAVSVDGRVDLDRYLWQPTRGAAATEPGFNRPENR